MTEESKEGQRKIKMEGREEEMKKGRKEEESKDEMNMYFLQDL